MNTGVQITRTRMQERRASTLTHRYGESFMLLRRPLKLATRLGITHGALVFSFAVLLLLTLQGLLRMLGLITDIRDTRLSSIDADEELHRAAWSVEVAVRHGDTACSAGAADAVVLPAIRGARATLDDVLRVRASAPPTRLRRAAQRYVALADGAERGSTCAYLLAPQTDALRAQLDEEMTNAWIEQLHDVHADIRAKEDAARSIGVFTAVIGLGLTAFGAIATAFVARATARSVSEPIVALAQGATRVGKGDFAPIPEVRGPAEVEDLWRDLDRMRESLMELERLKQAFLANVSHELRTPLARLREALGLLSDGTCGPTTARQERVLALATRACEREVRIVEALLDMSRLRSGLPLKLQAGCEIDRVVEAAAEEERTEAAEREVEVAFEKVGAAPSLEIDTALVERAIANLVRNAVSVSPRGKTVRIVRRVATAQASAGRTVHIEVSDDGPGIEESTRATLFTPFAAGAVPGANRPPGIGLGLAFARDVARAHGGDIRVASIVGRGTTFSLELPATNESTA